MEFLKVAFNLDERELVGLRGEALPAVHAVLVLDVDDVGRCNFVKDGALSADTLHLHSEAAVEPFLEAVVEDAPVASVAHFADDAHARQAPDVAADACVEEPDLLRLGVEHIKGIARDAMVAVFEDAGSDELDEVVADYVVAAELHEVRRPQPPLVDNPARASVELVAYAGVVRLEVVPALVCGHLFSPCLIADHKHAALDVCLGQLAQDAMEAFGGDLSHFLPFVDGEHDCDGAAHFLACFCALLSRRFGMM